MSITAISFYWRHDTPSFVTWRSRLATARDTPTYIVIHGGQFTGGVHPPNQFVPEIVSPLPCSPAYISDCLFFQRTYFFQWLPWQMPHQRFQRFDFICCWIGRAKNWHMRQRVKLHLVEKLPYQLILHETKTIWIEPNSKYLQRKGIINLGTMIFFPFSLFSNAFSFRIINPFPNKPWFLCACSTHLLKTLWEKEKLLVMFSKAACSWCIKISIYGVTG